MQYLDQTVPHDRPQLYTPLVLRIHGLHEGLAASHQLLQP
jgi:hypothetical protein